MRNESYLIALNQAKLYEKKTQPIKKPIISENKTSNKANLSSHKGATNFNSILKHIDAVAQKQ